MAFEIRKASVYDTQAVYSLICDLENETLPFDWFGEIYLRNLENASILYFVGDQSGEVIAFASLHIQSLLHHCSNIAEIQEIIVKPEHQRHGIGHKLFDVLETMARNSGCAMLEVCCNRKRNRSHRFYEGCGMTKSHYKFTYRLR